jgi:hypothetical protein
MLLCFSVTFWIKFVNVVLISTFVSQKRVDVENPEYERIMLFCNFEFCVRFNFTDVVRSGNLFD